MTSSHIFKNIVLGSGGVSGLSYLGVLRYFHEQGHIKHVKHCYGVSMGAFFAFLFASKIDITLIESELKTFYCSPENTQCYFDRLPLIQTTHGLNGGDRLILPLQTIYQKYYSRCFPYKSYTIDNLTFLEFAKHTGCTLTVVATNVQHKCPTFFSVDTTPHISVWKAIQASMTIPFLFEPVYINDIAYVDGYLTCEYPCPVALDKSTTLGIFIESLINTENSSSNTDIAISKTNALQPLSFIEYIIQIIETMIFYPKETRRIHENIDYIMKLTKNPIGFLPFKIDPTYGVCFGISELDIDLSMGYGYEKTYTFFTTLEQNNKEQTE